MTRNSVTVASAVIMIAVCFSHMSISLAQDLYNLKARTVHCSSPGPIKTGEYYPLQQKGCAVVGTVWGLLDDPVEVEAGVMKVEMGGVFGTRYVRSADVVKD